MKLLTLRIILRNIYFFKFTIKEMKNVNGLWIEKNLDSFFIASYIFC